MTTSVNHTKSSQPDNPKDWRNIDTRTPEGLRELDWYIARRLGWTLIRENADPDDERGRHVYVLRKPDGKQVGFTFKLGATFDDVFTPNTENRVPSFTTSPGAAFTLIPDPVSGISFALTNRISTNHANDWEATFTSYYKRVAGSSSTPALAICDAWCVFDGSDEWDAEAAPQPDASEGGAE